MDFNKFNRALSKTLRKSPEIFTSVETLSSDPDDTVIKITVDSASHKRGIKFFKDNTTGEINSILGLISTFKGSVKCISRKNDIQLVLQEGKRNYTFNIK